MLGRRVQQIVQQPLDGPSVRAALEALALCSDSNMEIRDVGETMRQRNSQLDAEFVQALGAVDGAFGALERSVNSLDAQCRALRATVNRALRCTAAAAEQAALLVDERRELRARLALAEEFMARFSLTDAETAQLSDRELSSDAYFGALDRVAVVRAECQKLSALPTQTAVNDLLRGLADQEEAANAAVLRWVVGCARDRLIRDLDPAFSAQLKKALRCLHAHPALFDAATGEIARARRDAVGRAFVAALVRGGPGGTPRPIEAHAGDALRYVGDMLAWAHQACASERELLDTLMGFEGVGESGRMLASALEAVARPLEMRVAQTVAEQTAPPALFRISALLAFYSDLFRALRLPADSPFMATVSAMCAGARDRLRGVLAAVLDAA
ncbi:Golgi transport complex subunit 6 [Coemansia thaxteri]|nr:Golgi transport complex subunit 6 [Coemansia thaxteri]